MPADTEESAPQQGGAFQRKLGPLKLWQWGAIVIGGVVGIVIVRRLFGGGAAAPDTTGTGAGTTAMGGFSPSQPGPDFGPAIQQLADSFNKGQQQLADALQSSNEANAQALKDTQAAIDQRLNNATAVGKLPDRTVAANGVLQSSGMTEQAIKEFLTGSGYSAAEAETYASSHIGTPSIQNFNDVNNYLQTKGFNR